MIAQTEADYEAWVKSQQQPLDATQQAFVESTLNTKWGCVACHSLEPVSKIETGPNLTHVGDRSTFAGGIYETTVDNLTKWVHNAPSRKPMGDLEAVAQDAQLLGAGHDGRRGPRDRRIPLQHGNRPGQRPGLPLEHPAGGSPMTRLMSEGATRHLAPVEVLNSMRGDTA